MGGEHSSPVVTAPISLPSRYRFPRLGQERSTLGIFLPQPSEKWSWDYRWVPPCWLPFNFCGTSGLNSAKLTVTGKQDTHNSFGFVCLLLFSPSSPRVVWRRRRTLQRVQTWWIRGREGAHWHTLPPSSAGLWSRPGSEQLLLGGPPH